MGPAHEIYGDSRRLEGRYSNYFRVGHNAFEFVVDFGQFYSENKEAHLHTRIITSPVYIKSLLETLRQSIERYEEVFGLIQGESCEEKPSQNNQPIRRRFGRLKGGDNDKMI